MESARKRDICERTFQFALWVLRLAQHLDKSPGARRTLSRQILRSGTSIGANVEEAQSAQSRPDFKSKINIALKEARETLYWLRLIEGARLVTATRLKELLRECTEIRNVLAAILLSTKRNSLASVKS